MLNTSAAMPILYVNSISEKKTAKTNTSISANRNSTTIAPAVAPMNIEMHTSALLDPAERCHATENVRSLTQWYTDELERLIRRWPEQYWWLHRRWKDTRPPRAERRAA